MYKQTIICMQLFAGHEVDSQPMKRKEKCIILMIMYMYMYK